MKQKLSNLIKTSRPLKNKVTDLIEDNLSLNDGGFSKLSIFPLKTKLPNIDSAHIEGNEPKITFNKEESPESSRETKQISDSYRSIDIVDDTRKMLENILNTSIINRNNSKNNITNIVEGTKNKNSVENVFNKNNMNSVENVFNRNDMNSLIQNISSTRNENKTTSPNYIKKSINLPFIKNETNNANENIDSSISNIKVSKPTISKFSDVNVRNTGQFTKENRHYTNNVQSLLENSPAIKVFERGKNVLKSTKEIMNHIITRQNSVIPMLEYGGMVNTPTLAMIGESGPESVLPEKMMNYGLPQNEEVSSLSSSGTVNTNIDSPRSTSLKSSFDSISKSAIPFNQSKLKIGPDNSQSITSLANTTLQERALYESQTAANSIRSIKMQQSQPTIDTKPFRQTPPQVKQTTSGPSAAGGGAGSNSFSFHFRNRIFSLPSWRQRLS